MLISVTWESSCHDCQTSHGISDQTKRPAAFYMGVSKNCCCYIQVA